MSKRFELALSNCDASDWQQFESLSAQFLGDEFPEHRTTASGAGDGGRDGMLLNQNEDDTVVIQVSVAEDWRGKINRTVKRLATTHPSTAVLIYATPHRIGAKADELTASIRAQNRIHLDIRDRSWFVERQSRSRTTRDAAGWFAEFVVGRLDQDETLIDHSGAALSDEEARAALLFLVLQRNDDDTDRQLTKQTYDALVRSVLRDTDNDDRKHRDTIHSDILGIMPSHRRANVIEYADNALARLSGRVIRHWQQGDTFCLSHEERERVAEERARLRLVDEELETELVTSAEFVAEPLGLDISLVDSSQLTTRLRRVLEAFLVQRGESFVDSLETGETLIFREEELQQLAEQDLNRFPDNTSLRGGIVPLVANTVTRVLLNPGENLRPYLRTIADAYTLLAFVRETPNVQSAISRLFTHGDFWLDTSAILPVLVENLLEPEERAYSQLLLGAHRAGASLFVTEGVLDEIDSHIRNCLLAWRSPTTWNARTPFLLAAHTWAGEKMDDFPAWASTFRGRERPIDDLRDYLSEVLNINLQSLSDEYNDTEEQLRWHCDEYWRSVHQGRRRSPSDRPIDPEIVRQLAEHDSESFLGVLHRRHREPSGSTFGYRSWWLTLDGAASRAAKEISDRSGMDVRTPVLSYDFLSNYLTVGPARQQLDKGFTQRLPVIMDTSLIDAKPSDLTAVADSVRERVRGQDTRIVKREVRDHLDREKLRGGRVGKTTLEAMEYDIRAALENRSNGRGSPEPDS